MAKSILSLPPQRAPLLDKVVGLTSAWREWFENVYKLHVGESGTYTERPTKDLFVGRQYFDTTFGCMVFWNGTAWVGGLVEKGMVYNSGTQTIANNTITQVTSLDTVAYAVGRATYASNSFTIPAGINYARFYMHVDFAANGTGIRIAYVYKDGAVMSNPSIHHHHVPNAANTCVFAVATPIIPVAAGQVYDMRVYQNSGGNLNIGAATALGGTSFAVEYYP